VSNILLGLTALPASEFNRQLAEADAAIIIDPLPFDDTPTDACRVTIIQRKSVIFTIISTRDNGYQRRRVSVQNPLSLEQQQPEYSDRENRPFVLVENKSIANTDLVWLLDELKDCLYDGPTRCINELRELLNDRKFKTYDPFEL
jgi:hypothetical protein